MDVPNIDSLSNRSPSQSVRLILMRHAKSDHGAADLSDFQRHLNDRGRRDSPLMADCLDELDWVPDLVLSSSSARTRETIDLMESQWRETSKRSDSTDSTPKICFSDALYLSSPETIVSTVREDHSDCRCVMVLAHNPGISGVASCLANQSIEMPTAAIVCFSFESPLEGLQLSDHLRLEHFIRPKSLL